MQPFPPQAAVDVERPPSLAWLIVFFVGSGLAGLLYQVVWVRELQLVLGASTLASGAVLTAFMGGFALGAAVIGPVGDRVQRPLRLYGFLEIGIGLSALGVPPLVDVLEPVYASASTSVPAALLTPLRFGVSVAVLLIPTALMGASLPVMVVQARSLGAGVTGSLSRLYSANLVGAILGTLLAGFVLVRLLGLQASNGVGVGLNLAIGIAACLLAGRPAYAAQVDPTSSPPSPPPSGLERLILPLLFLSGFCVLALEVLWMRLMVFSVQSTVQGFAVVLAVTLVGLAIGAKISQRLLRDPGRLPVRLAFVHAGVALSSVLGLVVIGPRSFSLILSLTPSEGTRAGFLLACAVASGSVLLIPATLAGMVFPVFAALDGARNPELASGVSRAQWVNSVGAILGSAGSSLLLIPTLGVPGGFALIAALQLLAGFALARRCGPKVLGVVAAMALATGASFFALPEQEDALDSMLGEHTLLGHAWGASSTVSVVEGDDGFRSLRINGFEAAGNARNYGYMRFMGLGPLLSHPAPRRALVICFGTGTTSGAVARDPGLERLDIVEIEGEVLGFAHLFSKTNLDVLEDPRVRAHVEDGRAFVVAAEPESYDVITLEPMPPHHAGVVALYSREFYAHCRRALRRDGVVCQWVPYDLLPGIHGASVVRTFTAEFPNAVIYMVDGTGVLIGTKGTRSLTDLSFIARRLSEMPEVVRELSKDGLGNAEAIMRRLALGPHGLATYAGSVPLVTDDRPSLEYEGILQIVESRKHLGSRLVLNAHAAEPCPELRSLGSLEERRQLGFALTSARLEGEAGHPTAAIERMLRLADSLDSPALADEARLHAARLSLDQGDRERAKLLLDQVSTRSADHPLARELREALTQGKDSAP